MPDYEATESQFERVSWNEDKRARNLAKHGVDFADIEAGFFRQHFRTASPRGTEMRYKAIGALKGEIIVIVYTEREEGRVCRLISAWRAKRKEKAAYRLLHS